MHIQVDRLELVGALLLELQTIEKNVTLLHTPYCDFTITDEDGKVISFDIMKSPGTNPDVWIDDKNQIPPVTYGTGKTLRIYTKNLKIKKNYYIRPSVVLDWRDSDERLFIYGKTGKDYTFAVSFPDPNDEEKFCSNCTEDDYHLFNIEHRDGVFILRLYDRDCEYIDIFMFWICNIQHHMSNYESACDVATWWCP